MPTKLPPAKSVGEETLALHLRAEGIPFDREYKFSLLRKWRADFRIYWDRAEYDDLLVEIDGGNRLVVKGKAVGRHMKDEDYDKMNEMVILGWRVLRFTPAQVKSGKAIDTIKRALA